MARIDQKVRAMIEEGSASLGPDAIPPEPLTQRSAARVTKDSPAASTRPTTLNPPAAELPATSLNEADNVLQRLQNYGNALSGGGGSQPLELTFDQTLAIAMLQAREIQFEREQYILAALRLLVERHLWGPRFFNDVSASVVGLGDRGMFDTSLQLVNDFRVTQRLPYGGEISARALALATEDLHHRVAGENVQSAELVLRADVPLLRGAGIVAREDLILAEREIIYAARDYEQFRREFVFSIAQDFMDVQFLQSSVVNAQQQVDLLTKFEEREVGLYEAGRSPLFQAALASQSRLGALDSLHTREEAARLALDRFKVRLGLSPEQSVVLIGDALNLPIPQTDINEAVVLALSLRLDLQTQRDVIDDALRGVEVARNQLLPDLNVTASALTPTDRQRARGGLRFRPDDSALQAGVTLSLPLDRQIERARVRQSQIQLERAHRQFDQLRDSIAVEVRAAVRDIDRAIYTLEIQQRNVEIGEQRVESIEAAPDRASARDSSEAANELLRATDRRDDAQRDLQLSIMRYLLTSGQLRVGPDGKLLLPPGMR